MTGEGSPEAMDPDAAPAGFNPVNRYKFPFHEAELEQIKLLLTQPDDDETINSDEEYHDLGEDILIEDNFEFDICDRDSDDESDDDDIEDNHHQEEWLKEPAEAGAAAAPDRHDELCIPPGVTTPYDYFNLLFTEELLNDIVAATNLCAANTLANTTISDQWKDLDVEELRVFLGLLLFMGVMPNSGITEFWKANLLGGLVRPKLAEKSMPRNRFLALFRFLKFGKENLNSLINHFNNTMSVLFVPGSDLLIDESMVLRRGREEIEMFIQGNRFKYGVELYALATPGAAVHLHMCQGRRDENADGIKRRDKVVFKLMAKFLNAGHHLLLPDYYNTVGLADFLLKNNTHLTGHLRKHRPGNPKIVVKSKLQRGESIYRYNQNGVCVCKWRGSQTTLMISTKWSPKLVPVVNKSRKMIVQKPEMVALFDEFLKCILDDDEEPNIYALKLKGMRWYKKVGIHVLHIMFLNAYHLYKTHNNLEMEVLPFKERLIEALLPVLRTRKNVHQDYSSDFTSIDSIESDSSSLEFESSWLEESSSEE